MEVVLLLVIGAAIAYIASQQKPQGAIPIGPVGGGGTPPSPNPIPNPTPATPTPTPQPATPTLTPQPEPTRVSQNGQYGYDLGGVPLVWGPANASICQAPSSGGTNCYGIGAVVIFGSDAYIWHGGSTFTLVATVPTPPTPVGGTPSGWGPLPTYPTLLQPTSLRDLLGNVVWITPDQTLVMGDNTPYQAGGPEEATFTGPGANSWSEWETWTYVYCDPTHICGLDGISYATVDWIMPLGA